MTMTRNDDETHGVGGWLLLFILTLATVIPLYIAYFLMTGVYDSSAQLLSGAPGWAAFRSGVTVVAGGQCAIALYLAWRLIGVRRWTTIRLAIAGIWLMGFGPIILNALIATAIYGRFPTIALGAVMPRALGAASYATLWTAYLLRSPRVANTYPRPSDEAGLAAVFD
jgi:hypothetical protein